MLVGIMSSGKMPVGIFLFLRYALLVGKRESPTQRSEAVMKKPEVFIPQVEGAIIPLRADPSALSDLEGTPLAQRVSALEQQVRDLELVAQELRRAVYGRPQS